MAWLGDLLRRARLRGVVEGLVQRVRAEALDDDAKDDVERWQDYGFAANPVDGQGLTLNVAGHTIVIRLDRLGERPQLAAYEVALWHKEGHMVRLKAGRVVEVICDELVVNATTRVAITSPQVSLVATSGVTLDTPVVNATGTVSAPTVVAASALSVGGVEVSGHTHPGVQPGSGTTGGMG